VLFLTTGAHRDWVETLENGAAVEVRRGSNAAILGGLDARLSIDDVARDARGLVNTALDLMAVRSLGGYSLTDATSPTITWALRGATTMRTTSDLHMTFGLSVGGRAKPPPSAWHPSMRYFRLSQTTTDLFDAFRNLYLASVFHEGGRRVGRERSAPVLVISSRKGILYRSCWTQRTARLRLAVGIASGVRRTDMVQSRSRWAEMLW